MPPNLHPQAISQTPLEKKKKSFGKQKKKKKNPARRSTKTEIPIDPRNKLTISNQEWKKSNKKKEEKSNR